MNALFLANLFSTITNAYTSFEKKDDVTMVTKALSLDSFIAFVASLVLLQIFTEFEHFFLTLPLGVQRVCFRLLIFIDCYAGVLGFVHPVRLVAKTLMHYVSIEYMDDRQRVYAAAAFSVLQSAWRLL